MGEDGRIVGRVAVVIDRPGLHRRLDQGQLAGRGLRGGLAGRDLQRGGDVLPRQHLGVGPDLAVVGDQQGAGRQARADRCANAEQARWPLQHIGAVGLDAEGAQEPVADVAVIDVVVARVGVGGDQIVSLRAAVQDRQAAGLAGQVTQAVDVDDGRDGLGLGVGVIAPDAHGLLGHIERAAGVVGHAVLGLGRQVQAARQAAVQLAVGGGIQQPLVQLALAAQGEDVQRAVAGALAQAQPFARIAQQQRARLDRPGLARGEVVAGEADAAFLAVEHRDQIAAHVDAIGLAAGQGPRARAVQTMELQAAQFAGRGDHALGGVGGVIEQGGGVGPAAGRRRGRADGGDTRSDTGRCLGQGGAAGQQGQGARGGEKSAESDHLGSHWRQGRRYDETSIRLRDAGPFRRSRVKIRCPRPQGLWLVNGWAFIVAW